MDSARNVAIQGRADAPGRLILERQEQAVGFYHVLFFGNKQPMM
jgi:hypothetical protein